MTTKMNIEFDLLELIIYNDNCCMSLLLWKASLHDLNSLVSKCSLHFSPASLGLSEASWLFSA